MTKKQATKKVWASRTCLQCGKRCRTVDLLNGHLIEEHSDLDFRLSNPMPTMSARIVEDESNVATPGNTPAKSSKQCEFFDDVPFTVYRRLAKRHTVGHVKYAKGLVANINWREGIDDPLYVKDRLNHAIDHIMSFLEDGNTKDDNLAGAMWNLGFLMEVERLAPTVIDEVIFQHNVFGKHATLYRGQLERAQAGTLTDRDREEKAGHWVTPQQELDQADKEVRVERFLKEREKHENS